MTPRLMPFIALWAMKTIVLNAERNVPAPVRPTRKRVIVSAFLVSFYRIYLIFCKRSVDFRHPHTILIQLSPSYSCACAKNVSNDILELHIPCSLHGHSSTEHPARYSFVAGSKNNTGSCCPNSFRISSRQCPQNSLPTS